MNESTKKLMLQMAKVCEEFYYQSCVYQAVLQSNGRGDWRTRVQLLLEDSGYRQRVHAKFQPLYTNLQAAEEMESEIDKGASCAEMAVVRLIRIRFPLRRHGPQHDSGSEPAHQRS